MYVSLEEMSKNGTEAIFEDTMNGQEFPINKDH